MTIQELGSLGELVAAIATLATLIYLALQIGANTTAVRGHDRSDGAFRMPESESAPST